MLARIAAIVAAKKAALQQAESAEKAAATEPTLHSSAASEASSMADGVSVPHAAKVDGLDTSTAQDLPRANAANAVHTGAVNDTDATDAIEIPAFTFTPANVAKPASEPSNDTDEADAIEIPAFTFTPAEVSQPVAEPADITVPRRDTNETDAALPQVLRLEQKKTPQPDPQPLLPPPFSVEAADETPTEISEDALTGTSEEAPAPATDTAAAPKDIAAPPALPAPTRAATTPPLPPIPQRVAPPLKEADATQATADAELRAETPAASSRQPDPVSSAFIAKQQPPMPPELPAPAKSVPVTPIPATPPALPAAIAASVTPRAPEKAIEQPSSKAVTPTSAATPTTAKEAVADTSDTPAPSSAEPPAPVSAPVTASATTQAKEDTVKRSEQEAETDADAQRRRRALREQRQQRIKSKEGSRSRKRASVSATTREQPSTWQTLWNTLRSPFSPAQTAPQPPPPPALPEKKQPLEAAALPATAVPGVPEAPAGAAPAPATMVATPVATAAETAPPTPTAEAAPSATTEENFAFMRDAQRRAFWQQPQVKAGLLAGIALGMLTLAAQWAYGQRAELAARIPLARAAFDALNLQVPPWQNIQAIEIQDSDFLLNPDNSYHLRVSLRNGSNHPVAMPALELMLLDDDEQLVAKRVITSDPALPMPTVIPPHGQWDATTEVVVQLPPSLAQRGIAGYRVAVFYP